jgi:hypothetical protein
MGVSSRPPSISIRSLGCNLSWGGVNEIVRRLIHLG